MTPIPRTPESSTTWQAADAAAMAAASRGSRESSGGACGHAGIGRLGKRRHIAAFVFPLLQFGLLRLFRAFALAAQKPRKDGTSQRGNQHGPTCADVHDDLNSKNDC